MQKNWIHYLFILVVCWFAFFMHNGVLYPDIMEARNFVTAREMVEFDNWLVPTMNGELRFAKPPLPTWVAALVEMVSPDNLVLQRAMAGDGRHGVFRTGGAKAAGRLGIGGNIAAVETDGRQQRARKRAGLFAPARPAHGCAASPARVFAACCFGVLEKLWPASPEERRPDFFNR